MNSRINRTDSGLEIEAEKILLGLILKSGSIPTDLSISHFTGQNKEVFKAIEKISKETIPDILNVSMMLKKENPDNSLIAYVTSLSSTEAVVSQIDYYMDMVIKNSNDRHIKELFEHGIAGKLSAEEVFSKASEINNSYKKPNHTNKFFTGLDIICMEDSINEQIVEGLIYIGVTTISGASKIGKSWLALGLWIAVQNGSIFLGKYKTIKASALYLSLEDNKKRLKKRLKIATQGDTGLLQEGSFINISFTGYVKELRSFLEQNPEIKLVIIDTLIKFKLTTDMGDYSQTTQVISDLKTIADELNIAIVVITHTKKGISKATEEDDLFDFNLGSTAIMGASDAMMVLKKKMRTEAEAELIITGRDFEDSSIILSFDKSLGSWTYKGDKIEVQGSKEQQEIFDYIKEHPGQTPKEIHREMHEQGTTRTISTLKNILPKMLSKGSLINKEGHYYVFESMESMESMESTESIDFRGDISEKSLNNAGIATKTIDSIDHIDPVNTEKQAILDLQPEYNHEIAKDILSYIEKNQHANITDELLTQVINGEYKDIMRAKDELIKGGYIFVMNNSYKYKQPALVGA